MNLPARQTVRRPDHPPAKQPAASPPATGGVATRQAQVLFVVPAYNEERNIGLLLEQTRAKMEELRQPYHVLIIDDGSHDRTAAIAQASGRTMSVEVIRHETNQGVGAVFRTGLRAALERGQPGDVIVTKEADNTSDLGILPAMLAHVAEGHDLVLASCYAQGGEITNTTRQRILLSSTANLILRGFFPIHGVCTYSSFYRAYTWELLQRATERYGDQLLTEPGFVCMVELLVKLAMLKPRLTEVPLTLRGDLRAGKSKMKVAQTTLGYVRFCLNNWRLWRATR